MFRLRLWQDLTLPPPTGGAAKSQRRVRTRNVLLLRAPLPHQAVPATALHVGVARSVVAIISLINANISLININTRGEPLLATVLGIARIGMLEMTTSLNFIASIAAAVKTALPVQPWECHVVPPPPKDPPPATPPLLPFLEYRDNNKQLLTMQEGPQELDENFDPSLHLIPLKGWSQWNSKLPEGSSCFYQHRIIDSAVCWNWRPSMSTKQGQNFWTGLQLITILKGLITLLRYRW